MTKLVDEEMVLLVDNPELASYVDNPDLSSYLQWTEDVPITEEAMKKARFWMNRLTWTRPTTLPVHPSWVMSNWDYDEIKRLWRELKKKRRKQRRGHPR